MKVGPYGPVSLPFRPVHGSSRPASRPLPGNPSFFLRLEDWMTNTQVQTHRKENQAR
jgi:hypothetical protein